MNLAGRLWLEHLSSDQQSNRISLSQCSVTQSNSRRLQPHPPTGGHGLNTAVHDAYNLSWKIAATLRSLWSDEPQAKEVRLRFEEATARQQMEFYEQNVEYGYTYDSPAIIPDGTSLPHLIDDVHVYEPSTRPGSALPHAWLHRLGQHAALCDLAGHGQFLLISGEGGEAWNQAAAHIAQEQGLPLKAISINPFSGDWLDTRFDWLRQHEVSSDGAVLVRPDRHVAWRSFGASENPQVTLEETLAQVLGAQQVVSH